MKIPKILYREDLEMPEGKLAAQVSHALMMVVTSQMKDCENGRFIEFDKSNALLSWRKEGYPFELIPASEAMIDQSINELDSRRFKVVIDQGRTVFEGVKTMTCMVVLPEQLQEEMNPSANIENLGEVKVKQHILVNLKQVGDDLVKSVAKASVSALFELASIADKGESEASILFDFEKEPALKSWLNGSFAKIGLGTKTQKKFNLAIAEADKRGIKYSKMNSEDGAPMVVGFEPRYADDLVGVTSSFHTIG